jgi:hypothetical protein
MQQILPGLITGLVTSLFGLIAGYWLTGCTVARRGRRDFRVFARCLLEEVRELEGVMIDGWHRDSVPKIREACIRVTDDVLRWNRNDFYGAWKDYCSLTADPKQQNGERFIGPTYETTMEGIKKGTHTLPNFDTARHRVEGALRRVFNEV